MTIFAKFATENWPDSVITTKKHIFANQEVSIEHMRVKIQPHIQKSVQGYAHLQRFKSNYKIFLLNRY